MIKEQITEKNYTLISGDCMDVLPNIPNSSIDLSIYSPPFAGLYNYSSSERDFSNCENKEQFLSQYDFLVAEMARVTKSGRINAVHCSDVITNTTAHTLWDFPHEIIKIHLKYGFTYNNRITIWKEPLEVRTRTMVNSLKHIQIVEDSTKCYTAIPDYLLIFRKGGENKTPVTHLNGLTEFEYFGITPLLPEMIEKYGNYEHLKIKYKNHKEHSTNKLAHITWQRYASSVWDDIRGKNVLDFKNSREEDDEKHVHPLQLDIIDRIVLMYSNPNETVLTPFMGVGSEVYSPISMGRNAIGIELKESYYKQAVLNLKEAENRFKKAEQKTLF
jgi:DNA modification methylase